MHPFALRTSVTACLLAALTACGPDQAAGPAPPSGLNLPIPSRDARDVSGRQAIPFIVAAIQARAAEDSAYARRSAAYLAHLESLLGRGGDAVPVNFDVAAEEAQWWTFLQTTVSEGIGFGSISAGMGWSIDDVWGVEQNMIWTVMDGTTEVGEGSYADKAGADMLSATAHEFYSHHSFSMPQGQCIWLKGHTVHSVNRPILVFNHWLRADSYDEGRNPCEGSGGPSGGYTGDSDDYVCYEQWLVWYGTEVYLGDVCYAVSGNMS